MMVGLNSENLRICLGIHDPYQGKETLRSSAWALSMNSLHLNYHQEVKQSELWVLPEDYFFPLNYFIYTEHYNAIVHIYHIFTTQDNI